MYLFTRNTQLFTVVLSFYFGISVATFLYLSKADYVCNAKTAAYCYPIIGVAASIILCLIYSILPNIGRAYVALLPTMLIGFVLNLQVNLLIEIFGVTDMEGACEVGDGVGLHGAPSAIDSFAERDRAAFGSGPVLQQGITLFP